MASRFSTSAIPEMNPSSCRIVIAPVFESSPLSSATMATVTSVSPIPNVASTVVLYQSFSVDNSGMA